MVVCSYNHVLVESTNEFLSCSNRSGPTSHHHSFNYYHMNSQSHSIFITLVMKMLHDVFFTAFIYMTIYWLN